jgi:hypothetical protein
MNQFRYLVQLLQDYGICLSTINPDDYCQQPETDLLQIGTVMCLPGGVLHGGPASSNRSNVNRGCNWSVNGFGTIIAELVNKNCSDGFGTIIAEDVNNSTSGNDGDGVGKITGGDVIGTSPVATARLAKTSATTDRISTITATPILCRRFLSPSSLVSSSLSRRCFQPHCFFPRRSFACGFLLLSSPVSSSTSLQQRHTLDTHCTMFSLTMRR